MIFAHVTGATVDQVGQPPRLLWDGTRWWDLRDRTPAVLTPHGWHEVVPADRPPDTDTTTHDQGYQWTGTQVVQTWTARPWTPAELAGRTAAANTETLRAGTAADLTTIRDQIDALAVLLADDTTTGSIRQIIGPTGATAGTGSLRALKAQTNTAVVNAASIKALIDLTITLAQRTIDDAQATRRIARQVLRVARLTIGDTSSADVGTA